MNLIEFLENIKPEVLKKIQACGDDPAEFYKPVTEKYTENNKPLAGLRVMGAETETNFELRINIWSRDQSEINDIEEIIKGEENWRKIGERAYQYGDYFSLTFEKDATMVYTQQQNFTNETYCEQVNTFLNYIIEIISIFS